jgi:hypothetical protein
MDRNLAYKWQSVPLQASVDDNHVQRHLPVMNRGPDYATLFDMTLVLTIVFSLFELAVELLRIESLNEVVALVAATAVWTTLACGAEVFISSALLRFYVLFSAGFVASILMLVSHIMLAPLGMALYSIDCLGKFAVVMLALQIRSKR